MISIGIQNSGSTDNIKKEIFIDLPLELTSAGFTAVINALPLFSVSNNEIPTFKAITPIDVLINRDELPTRRTTDTNSQVTYYVELLNVGRGQYGVGGLQLTTDNIKITSFSTTTHDICELGSTQVIDLGYSNIEIVDYINEQMPNIFIQEQSEGYVIVKGIIMGDFREFLWLGIGGEYGRNGLQCSYTDLKEFLYINEANIVHKTNDETIKGAKTFINEQENAKDASIIIINNTEGGNGSKTINFLSGIGQYIWNIFFGIGLYIKNSSAGIALFVEIEASGDGIVSNALDSATGKLFVGKSEGIEIFSVDKLGVIEGTKIINKSAPGFNILLANGNTIAQSDLPGPDLSFYYNKTEVDAKLSSVYKFMGNVASYSALPSSGRGIGHVYNLLDTGANYAWTGSDWDKLGDTIDLSRYIPYTGATSYLNLGDFPIFARYFISRGRFLATEIGVGSDAFSAESSDGKYFGIMRNFDNTGTLVLYNSLGTESRISLNGMNGTVAANLLVKNGSPTTNLLLAGGGDIPQSSLPYLPVSAGVATGVVITFLTDRVYGSLETPETGNIMADRTDAKLGVTNIIIHNSGTAPAFGSDFKILSGSGNYSTSNINYIFCTFISHTEIIYSINQRT